MSQVTRIPSPRNSGPPELLSHERTSGIPDARPGEGQGGGKDEGRGSSLPPSPSLPRKGGEGFARRLLRLRRWPWEGLATIVIAIGVIMLMQPIALALFTWSFVTILAGTAMFVIVSHFPD
jgi:hypothetical protein